MKANIRDAKKNKAKRDNIISRKPKKGFSQAKHSPVDRILHLQRTIGNRAVTRLIQSCKIQARLKIGKPNDIHEKEADRVADRVMTMPDPAIRRQAKEEEKEEIQTKPLAEQITPLVQRQPEEDEEIQQKSLLQRQPEENEEVQSKAAPGSAPKVAPNIESSLNSMRGGGQPLSESTRSFFEPRFGADFSQVRVHTDSRAVETAQAINAKAFTSGKDIVFNTGQYAPGTTPGKGLLGHELAHVIQQNVNFYDSDKIRREKMPVPLQEEKTLLGFNTLDNLMQSQCIDPTQFTTDALGKALMKYDPSNKNFCKFENIAGIFCNLDVITQEYNKRKDKNEPLFIKWGTFRWPAEGTITSPFGWRPKVENGKEKKSEHENLANEKKKKEEKEFHGGIDIFGGSTRISAANGGIVEYAGRKGGYGNTVIINHGRRDGKDYVTLYAHLKKISVSVGQCVSEGMDIGIMGDTGRTQGVHLHFEIRMNNRVINPLSLITR